MGGSTKFPSHAFRHGVAVGEIIEYWYPLSELEDGRNLKNMLSALRVQQS